MGGLRGSGKPWYTWKQQWWKRRGKAVSHQILQHLSECWISSKLWPRTSCSRTESHAVDAPEDPLFATARRRSPCPGCWTPGPLQYHCPEQICITGCTSWRCWGILDLFLTCHPYFCRRSHRSCQKSPYHGSPPTPSLSYKRKPRPRFRTIQWSAKDYKECSKPGMTARSSWIISVTSWKLT